MSDMTIDATLEVRENQLQTMLSETAVGYHEELYVNVAGNQVRLLAGNPGHASGTYTDYDEAWFEDIDGSAEAYISVGELRSYLSLVSDDMAEYLLIHFESGSDTRMSDRVRIVPEQGDHFEVTLMLPSGRHVLEAVPTGLPDLFTADDRLESPDTDQPLEVEIETYLSELAKVRDAVDLRDGEEHYPIVVENGALQLDVGSERDRRVTARLNADVDGPDVSCRYKGHFSEIVDELGGDISLNLEQDSTMALVQDKKDRTIRHVIGAAA